MRDYDEVLLENVPQTSPLLRAVEECSPPLLIKKHVSDVCPYLPMGEQTEEVLLKIEAKQSLKRKVRKLSEKGTLRFRHYSDPLEMEKAVFPLLEANLKRFDPLNLENRLPLEKAFHLELLRRMGPEQMIRFAALELDNRSIAQHFGFGYKGVYYWVKPAFDPLYAEYSPGRVLLYNLIEHAWKNGFREFDFLRGKEPFKINIAGQMRRVMMVKLYRSLPKYMLCRVAAAIYKAYQRRAFRQT
jgi:CelD/BcsL family acetyltransferase involved in cellulose biosynthesis